MSNLAVFDFDSTVVNDDSDSVIIRKLAEKQPPPKFDSSNDGWTPYMSNVFEHAFTAGLRQDEILDGIASMLPNAGMIELFEALSVGGWDILLLTDANSVFVEHWVQSHGLDDIVFPRRGFPLDDLIKRTLATPTPEVVAKVVPWDDGNTIIKELFPDPDKMASSSVNQIDSRSSEMIKVR